MAPVVGAGCQERQPFEPSVPRVVAAASYWPSGGRRRLGGAIRHPGARTATGRGPEEPPRQLRWSGPVSSPACDPAPPPVSTPLPTTDRVGGRVSRRVLRPVSPPVADRVAPPTPGLHAGYDSPMRSPSPFVHEFRTSLADCPQRLHIPGRGSRWRRSPPAGPPSRRRRERRPPGRRSAARSSVHRSVAPRRWHPHRMPAARSSG
jgi:hypothetical protein